MWLYLIVYIPVILFAQNYFRSVNFACSLPRAPFLLHVDPRIVEKLFKLVLHRIATGGLSILSKAVDSLVNAQ